MSDVYKIAARLTMEGNALSFMQTFSREILGAHVHLKDLQGGLNKIKLTLLGIGALKLGTSMAHGLAKLVEDGNKLVKVQRDMYQAGMDSNEVQAAYAKAWQLTGRYMNVSASQSLDLMKDSRAIFGDGAEAIKHSGSIVGVGSFLRAYMGGEKGGETWEGMKQELMAGTKSGELFGKIKGDDLGPHLANMAAMKVVMGSQVSMQQYLRAQRAAGVSLRNSSDAFRYGIFPALVQENSTGAGVMLMTAWNKIVAGTGNKTDALQSMAHAGLLDEKQLKYDKTGRIIGLKDPSAIKGNRLAAENFGAWVVQDFLPKLQAEAGDDPIRQMQLIGKKFPDRNAAKAVMEFIQQNAKFLKDAKMLSEVRRNFDDYTKGSYDYNLQSFQTQWNNLMEALGSSLVPAATVVLGTLATGINTLAQAAADHPEIAKIATETVAVVAGLSALAGAITLVAGALRIAGFLTAAGAAGGAGAGAAGGAVAGGALGLLARGGLGLLKRFGPLGLGVAAIDQVATHKDDIDAFGEKLKGKGLEALTHLQDEFLNFLSEMKGKLESLSKVCADVVGAIGRFANSISSLIGSLISGFSKNLNELKGAPPTGLQGLPMRYKPAGPPPGRGGAGLITVQSPIHLDGRKIADVVTHHQVVAANFPRQAPYHSSRGSYSPADMGFQTA